MRSGLVETAAMAGSGKGAQGWFPLRQAQAHFDHPAHAPFEEAVVIDFLNLEQGPDARVAIELSVESARALTQMILTSLEAPEAMCSGLVETTAVDGSSKGSQGWFPLRQAQVYFEHPVHAPLEEAAIIDFLNQEQGPGARVAVELSVESARALAQIILASLEAGEHLHGAATGQKGLSTS